LWVRKALNFARDASVLTAEISRRGAGVST